MITLTAFFVGTAPLNAGIGTLLFWALTALVIWGFVDLATTSPPQFACVEQSLTVWIIAFTLFGPVACVGWLAVRRKVKSAQPISAVVPNGFPASPPYPYQHQPFIPPHLGYEEEQNGRPPLR